MNKLTDTRNYFHRLLRIGKERQIVYKKSISEAPKSRDIEVSMDDIPRKQINNSIDSRKKADENAISIISKKSEANDLNTQELNKMNGFLNKINEDLSSMLPRLSKYLQLKFLNTDTDTDTNISTDIKKILVESINSSIEKFQSITEPILDSEKLEEKKNSLEKSQEKYAETNCFYNFTNIDPATPRYLDEELLLDDPQYLAIKNLDEGKPLEKDSLNYLKGFIPYLWNSLYDINLIFERYNLYLKASQKTTKEILLDGIQKRTSPLNRTVELLENIKNILK